jgi:hypothetical protein
MKLILTLVYLLCVSVMPTFAATNIIQIFSFDFGSNSPPTHIDPIIQVGDTVEWQWTSSLHSTTASPGQLETWDSGVRFTTPSTFDHTFSNVGTFGYYCSVHGANGGCGNGIAMSGKVIVVLPGATADRITAITQQGGDVSISWITGGLCKTNALQMATGATDGSYTNNFTDLFVITNTVDNFTNYLDVGAATNAPSRYYRVRLVP